MAQFTKRFNAELVKDTQWPYYIDEEDITPAKKFIEDTLWQRQCYTPDMDVLNKNDYHLLFVYGSLKKNHSSHQEMKNAKFLGSALSLSDSFVMWEAKNLTLCTALRTDERAIRRHIFGELWVVPAATLVSLDIFEGNGGAYDRQNIAVRMISPNAGCMFSAYVYLGAGKFFNEKINAGQYKFCNQFTHKKTSSKYYFFMRMYKDK